MKTPSASPRNSTEARRDSTASIESGDNKAIPLNTPAGAHPYSDAAAAGNGDNKFGFGFDDEAGGHSLYTQAETKRRNDLSMAAAIGTGSGLLTVRNAFGPALNVANTPVGAIIANLAFFPLLTGAFTGLAAYAYYAKNAGVPAAEIKQNAKDLSFEMGAAVFGGALGATFFEAFGNDLLEGVGCKDFSLGMMLFSSIGLAVCLTGMAMVVNKNNGKEQDPKQLAILFMTGLFVGAAAYGASLIPGMNKSHNWGMANWGANLLSATADTVAVGVLFAACFKAQNAVAPPADKATDESALHLSYKG